MDNLVRVSFCSCANIAVDMVPWLHKNCYGKKFLKGNLFLHWTVMAARMNSMQRNGLFLSHFPCESNGCKLTSTCQHERINAKLWNKIDKHSFLLQNRNLCVNTKWHGSFLVTKSSHSRLVRKNYILGHCTPSLESHKNKLCRKGSQSSD